MKKIITEEKNIEQNQMRELVRIMLDSMEDGDILTVQNLQDKFDIKLFGDRGED